MNKNIPYSKLSKKEKRKEDLKGRITWKEFAEISPVSRIVESKNIIQETELRVSL